jgi:hypothetical protein
MISSTPGVHARQSVHRMCSWIESLLDRTGSNRPGRMASATSVVPRFTYTSVEGGTCGGWAAVAQL